MKDIETVVSENIQKILKDYSLNQTELAKIAGVSESTVGKWVLKKATPRMGSVEKIANYFNLPKSYILEEEEEAKGKVQNIMVMETPVMYELKESYTYFPTAISAGLPLSVDGITEASKISISDEVLGKYAHDKDLYFARANGDSMDKLFKDGSLLAIKPVTLDNLKNGDIVVFSDNHEYSVKHYHKYGNTIVFTPNSTNTSHKEQEYSVNDNITIHGKVVTYIVNLD